MENKESAMMYIIPGICSIHKQEAKLLQDCMSLPLKTKMTFRKIKKD